MSNLVEYIGSIEEFCEYRICQCREYVDTDLDDDDECCDDYLDDCDGEEVYCIYW